VLICISELWVRIPEKSIVAAGRASDLNSLLSSNNISLFTREQTPWPRDPAAQGLIMWSINGSKNLYSFWSKVTRVGSYHIFVYLYLTKPRSFVSYIRGIVFCKECNWVWPSVFSNLVQLLSLLLYSESVFKQQKPVYPTWITNRLYWSQHQPTNMQSDCTDSILSTHPTHRACGVAYPCYGTGFSRFHILTYNDSLGELFAHSVKTLFTLDRYY